MLSRLFLLWNFDAALLIQRTYEIAKYVSATKIFFPFVDQEIKSLLNRRTDNFALITRRAFCVLDTCYGGRVEKGESTHSLCKKFSNKAKFAK